MKVLVTGGAGFIGSALVKKLLEYGHEVTVLDNLVAMLPLPKGADNIVGGVENIKWWEYAGRHDAVYHLAASFANQRSVDRPAEDAHWNIVGTVNAATYAKQWGARLIYTGSSSTYGEADFDYGGQLIPFNESYAVHPHTPYALSKYVGEQYIRLLKPDALVLRLFNVFGQGDPPFVYRNALPLMAKAALSKGEIIVYGRLCSRDFMHIDTLVYMLVQMLDNDMTGTFNVCTGKETFMLAVANALAKKTGARVAVAAPRAWDKVARRMGDTTKIRRYFDLAIKEAPSVFDKLDEVLDYVRTLLYDQNQRNIKRSE